MKTTNPVILVHGYDYDPSDPDHSPAKPGGFFNALSDQVNPDRTCIPFPWYSGRKIHDLGKAWGSGYLTTYSWAYQELAEVAAMQLATLRTEQQASIICHSLGSRVVLKVLDEYPNWFRMVIFLNGAETVEKARPIIKKNKWTRFLNVSVSTDDVLGKLGAWFEPEFGKHHCIGYRGIGLNQDNLFEVQLDDQGIQQHFKSVYGFNLKGDNPKSIGDHRYSYLHSGNWDLYRHFLNHGEV